MSNKVLQTKTSGKSLVVAMKLETCFSGCIHRKKRLRLIIHKWRQKRSQLWLKSSKMENIMGLVLRNKSLNIQTHREGSSNTTLLISFRNKRIKKKFLVKLNMKRGKLQLLMGREAKTEVEWSKNSKKLTVLATRKWWTKPSRKNENLND